MARKSATTSPKTPEKVTQSADDTHAAKKPRRSPRLSKTGEVKEIESDLVKSSVSVKTTSDEKQKTPTTSKILLDKHLSNHSPALLVGEKSVPKIERLPPSDLLKRLQNFLPQMKEANAQLDQDLSKKPEGHFDIENVEEDKPYIEMDIYAGVLEAKEEINEENIVLPSDQKEGEEEEEDQKEEEGETKEKGHKSKRKLIKELS
eukprot:Colp12_sorted_trinity150504_noHs@923